MKVKINEWKGVAIWHWDVPAEEVCGICRVSFDSTCSACKFPGDECPLAVGTCTHRFHMHCIVKWLETETAKNLCPMCRRPFKMKESYNRVEPGDIIRDQQNQDDGMNDEGGQMGPTYQII